MINIEEYEDKIYEAAEDYFNESNFFYDTNISSDKIKNAMENMGIPKNDKIMALIDCTVFGGAEKGLAVCSSGLYWKNMWGVKTHKKHLSWEEFKDVKIEVLPEDRLQLGKNNIFHAITMSPEDTCNFLTKIQSILKTIAAKDLKRDNGAQYENEKDVVLDVPGFNVKEWDEIDYGQLVKDFEKNKFFAEKKYCGEKIIIKGIIKKIDQGAEGYELIEGIMNGFLKKTDRKNIFDRLENWYYIVIEPVEDEAITCFFPKEAKEIVLEFSTGDNMVFAGWFFIDDKYERKRLEVKYYFTEEGFDKILKDAKAQDTATEKITGLEGSETKCPAINELDKESQFQENEKGYVGMVKSFFEQGIIEEQRTVLDTLRISSNISDERAKEIEMIIQKEMGLSVEIEENEQGFVGMVKQFIEKGSLEDNMAMLDTLAESSGISEERKKILLEWILSQS